MKLTIDNVNKLSIIFCKESVDSKLDKRVLKSKKLDSWGLLIIQSLFKEDCGLSIGLKLSEELLVLIVNISFFLFLRQ